MAALRTVQYEDDAGRYWARMLPDTAPDYDAAIGIPVGPPSLDELGLPDEVTTRLHNELYNRKILTARDVRLKRGEIMAALMAALRVDVERIVAIYLAGEVHDEPAPEHSAVQPNAAIHNRRPRRTRPRT